MPPLDTSPETERLRDVLRAHIATLSGEPLRELVARVCQLVIDQMAAETRALHAASGRFTHIVAGGHESLCGRPHIGEGFPYIGSHEYFGENEKRADLCPECVTARLAAYAAARGRDAEEKRQATLKRRRARDVQKTDAAEAFVRAHPEGVTRDAVAAHIGQEPRTADSTLRHVRETRGSIEHRGRAGKWYPSEGVARTPLYQQAILRVLADAAEPLDVTDVHACVGKLRPEATLKGVAEELYRMREMTPPLVEQRGENENGLLFALHGGETTEAVH